MVRVVYGRGLARDSAESYQFDRKEGLARSLEALNKALNGEGVFVSGRLHGRFIGCIERLDSALLDPLIKREFNAWVERKIKNNEPISSVLLDKLNLEEALGGSRQG